MLQECQKSLVFLVKTKKKTHKITKKKKLKNFKSMY